MAKAPTSEDERGISGQVDAGFILRDLAGEPMKIEHNGQQIDYLLGHVIIQVVMASPPQGAKPYTVEQQLARRAIARSVQAAFAAVPPIVDLDPDFVEDLAHKIAAGFPPGIAGPALEELLK